MIRKPKFQVRQRKWKTVLFLLRKRKRKLDNNNDDDDAQHSSFAEILAPNNKILAPNVDDYLDDVADEDENPRNYDDERTDESCEDESSKLGLGLDVAAAEMDENPRNEDEEQIDENVNSRLRGLGLDCNDEEEKEVKDSKSGAMKIISKDIPPDDDCCPICFDKFTIACKTNCGHWFCAQCILQLWTYRTVTQKCSCPVCAHPIRKLTPESSLLLIKEVEVVKVLKNVQNYNRLFQGGINSVIQKVLEVPNVILKILCVLMDPDRFRLNYYSMRGFALMMSCIYDISPFGFIPTGIGAGRLFDRCAIVLALLLCFVGICYRLVLRRCVRRLAGNQV